MSVRSWGNYPKVHATAHRFRDLDALRWLLARKTDYIARGNGRSYGDSSLYENLLDVRPYDYFLAFDEQDGTISVQAGALLADILELIVPNGWFLPTTPGTRYVTVGGAIASDVHGKNHHLDGSFCRYVTEFSMMLAGGDIVTCSRGENEDLFRATCGGMGLTGIILSATIRLRRISSSLVDCTIVKTTNLDETLQAFETYKDRPYSAAWIDAIARGNALGRGLVSIGEHAEAGPCRYESRRRLPVPFNLPSLTLNSLAVRLFNTLYYKVAADGERTRKLTIDDFFYPLDAVPHWNRIYGRKGFIQYQFVLPRDKGRDGLHEILATVGRSGQAAPLAVLKLLGEGNDNWLSFPLHGYTLALDFRITKKLFKFLPALDDIVVRHGGRFYLAKDARVPRETFEAGYEHIDRFRALREQYRMNTKFNSLQSKRLGI